MCHWGRISSPNPFPPSQLTSCLQGTLCKVALEKYSGISALVAWGWSSACLSAWNIHQFRKQCLCHCVLLSPERFGHWGKGKLFLCVPASSSEKSLCFSGLKGGFCRLYFISESALPWWGLCKRLLFLLQEFGEGACEGRVHFGISVTLGALRGKKEKFLLWWLLLSNFSDFQRSRSTMIY